LILKITPHLAYVATLPCETLILARCGGIFNIDLPTNLPRNFPENFLKNRFRFDRIMVMSLWPQFFGPPCMLSHFSRTPTCDKHRQPQTQGHSMYCASIASRGKNEKNRRDKVAHAQKRNPLSDQDKIRHGGSISDVITYANFGDYRLRGFWVAGVKFSPPPFPLAIIVALKHSRTTMDNRAVSNRGTLQFTIRRNTNRMRIIVIAPYAPLPPPKKKLRGAIHCFCPERRES